MLVNYEIYLMIYNKLFRLICSFFITAINLDDVCPGSMDTNKWKAIKGVWLRRQLYLYVFYNLFAFL